MRMRLSKWVAANFDKTVAPIVPRYGEWLDVEIYQVPIKTRQIVSG